MKRIVYEKKVYLLQDIAGAFHEIAKKMYVENGVLSISYFASKFVFYLPIKSLTQSPNRKEN